MWEDCNDYLKFTKKFGGFLKTTHKYCDRE